MIMNIKYKNENHKAEEVGYSVERDPRDGYYYRRFDRERAFALGLLTDDDYDAALTKTIF